MIYFDYIIFLGKENIEKMKVNLNYKENEDLSEDEFILDIQYSSKNHKSQHFIEYIKSYDIAYKNKVIVENDDYSLLEINCDDIIMFYSNKKNNYCKTKNGTYRIKSKLYELEKIDSNFMRISKSTIVNIKHIEKFDLREIGKIVIKLDNSIEVIVSR